MTAVQERTVVERSFEFRTATDGDGLTLSGYAAVFNTPTRIDSWEGQFDEVIARGAFKKTIAERMPIMQWNHGNDPAIGQVPIGAITTLREDSRGLFVEARLHDNDLTKPVRDAIASGAVSGMSFKFQVLNESNDVSGDVPVRTVKEVRLFEVGPVANPAYPTTSVGVRSEDRDVVVVVTGSESETEDDCCMCPSCQAECDATDKFCGQCGTQLPAGVPCLNCGQMSSYGDVCCTGCGQPLPQTNSATSPRAAIARVGEAGVDRPQDRTCRQSRESLRRLVTIERTFR